MTDLTCIILRIYKNKPLFNKFLNHRNNFSTFKIYLNASKEKKNVYAPFLVIFFVQDIKK